MTPEQQQEMWEWYQSRKTQQLSYPVDEASKNALEALTYAGTSALAVSSNTSVPAGGGVVTVGRIPTGFLTVNIQGANYIIAYYT